MADNTILSTNVGTGDNVRDKDRAGVKTQIVGIDIGIGGSEKLMISGQTTMANSLCVAIASDQTLPLPSGAATAANQATEVSSLASIDSKITACNTTGLALDASVTGLQVAQGSTTAGEVGNLVQGAVTTSAPTYTTAKTNPLSLNTSGGLRVDVAQVNGVTVLMGNGVSGTGAQRVTIASDSTGQVALAAGSAVIGHVIVDAGSAVIGHVIIDSGSLTANAGTNLNTSALALEAGNIATVAGAIISQEATTSGVKGITAFGAVTTASPTYTTAKSDALSLDTAGNLRVSIKDSPANTNKFLVTPDLPSGASTAAKQPALGTAGTASSDVITIQGIASMTKLLVTPDANSAVNVAQINGVTPLMGNGVSGTGAQRVTIASDSTGQVALAASSAVIGHVIVDSGTITTVSAVTAITNALPAGTNLLGQVSASAETATVYSGTTALTPKFANISAASSGENTLVAAVSSKKIRVLSLFLLSTGTVNAYFDNATNGGICGDSTNKLALVANMGFVLPFNQVGWFQTGTNNEALRINLSGAVAVVGAMTYVEV